MPVGAGAPSSTEGELDKLLRERRREIVEWLQERRDDRGTRERLTCWIVVATLIVALLNAAIAAVIVPPCSPTTQAGVDICTVARLLGASRQ